MEIVESGIEDEDSYVSVPRGGPIYVPDFVGPITRVPIFLTSVAQHLQDLEAEISQAHDQGLSVDELKIFTEEELMDKAFKEAFKDGEGAQNSSQLADENSNAGKVDMTAKSSIFSSVITASPTITTEKLIGSENYCSWSAYVELWFMGQGYEDHLVLEEVDISEDDRAQWKKIDAQLCNLLWQSVDSKILFHLRAYKTCFKFWNQAKGLYINDIQHLYEVVSTIVNVRQQDMDLSTYVDQIASLKEEFLTLMSLATNVGAQQTLIDRFFMVLTLIGLRPNLETVRDQILSSSSIPSLNDVFAHLLRISSTQTVPTNSSPDSSVLVSQTNSRGGHSSNRGRGQRPHCTYCNRFGHTRDRCFQLHGRPPQTAHLAQSSGSQPPHPPSSSSSQGRLQTHNCD